MPPPKPAKEAQNSSHRSGLRSCTSTPGGAAEPPILGAAAAGRSGGALAGETVRQASEACATDGGMAAGVSVAGVSPTDFEGDRGQILRGQILRPSSATHPLRHPRSAARSAGVSVGGAAGSLGAGGRKGRVRIAAEGRIIAPAEQAGSRAAAAAPAAVPVIAVPAAAAVGIPAPIFGAPGDITGGICRAISGVVRQATSHEGRGSRVDGDRTAVRAVSGRGGSAGGPPCEKGQGEQAGDDEAEHAEREGV
eukprot:scaffold12145_cov101-Isochrysis_galbana.AAC.2